MVAITVYAEGSLECTYLILISVLEIKYLFVGHNWGRISHWEIL